MLQQNMEFNVHSQNQLRQVFNYFVPDLKATLKRFVGMKVQKKDGSGLSKRLKDAIEPILNHQESNITLQPFTENGFVSIQILRLTPDMWLKIALCFSGGKCGDKSYYCYYVDESYYMGDTTLDGYLENVVEKDTMDLVDVEVEKTYLMKAQDLKEQFEKVNSKLLPDNRLTL